MNRSFTQFSSPSKVIHCRYFPTCSGCHQQRNLHDHPKLKRLAQFYPYVELNVDEVIHWRHRVKLAVGGKSDRPLIGLYREGSHEIVDIPTCPLHTKGINDVVQVIKESIGVTNLAIYNEKSGDGVLRYIQIVQQRDEKKFQIALVVNAPAQVMCQHPFINDLIKRLGNWLDGLWLNEKTGKDNVIFSQQWHHVVGEKFLKNRILNRPFYFHPAAFCQVHLPIYEKVLMKIRSWLDVKKNVLELYAGCATIGKNIADLTRSIDAYESNPWAYASFEQSQQAYLDQNVRYFQEPSEKFPIDQDYQIAILDPPRKGISLEVFSKLKELKTLEMLIMLYCDTESFLRDCQLFQDHGWIVKSVEPYLFFPGSHHIEILARLEKRI